MVCAVLAISISGESTAENFRNILTVSHIDYDQIGISTVFENTFIARVRSKNSILVKVYHDERKNWHNNIFTLGSIINIGKYHYAEISYGYGIDADDSHADFFIAELTREKPGYIAGLGLKHGAYPEFSYSVISPSIRYNVTRRFALWAKAFLSIDSDRHYDQAYWSNFEYSYKKIAAMVGFTKGNRLYSPEYESLFGDSSDMSFFSVMAQCSFNINSRITLKYHYENLSRRSKYTDIKNTLILFAKF